MRKLFVLVCVLIAALSSPTVAQTVSVDTYPSWQDSKITLKAGENYRLSTTGAWSFGPLCGITDATGKNSSFLCEMVAEGFITAYPDVAVVGKVGKNGTPFYIGLGIDYQPTATGVLYLGPNVHDPVPDDNQGQMSVNVTRLSEAVVAPVVSPPVTNLEDAPVIQVDKGPRVALIIGNSSYQTAPLPNPVNDAALMAQTLKSIGFRVILKQDARQKDIKRAIREFGDMLEEAGKDAVGVFYYAGHGVQVGGRNYLIPIGAPIDNEKDVDIEAVAADTILGAMEYAGNRMNVVILDACRNNPFKRSFRSSVRGLARMDAPRGSLIAYSTSPGNVAADGEGANSPYTLALSQALVKENIAIERMFRLVRNDVMKATNDFQIPWEASSLTGSDFYFNAVPKK